MTETANGLATTGRPGQRTGPGPGRGGAPLALAAAAISVTAVFAGGGLLTQTVVVPSWRRLDPAAALAQFAKDGPMAGATLFPFEFASVVLVGVVLYAAVRRRSRAWPAWALSWACMVGTLVLLPAYFLAANDALVNGTLPLDQVSAALQSWYAWNWVRTGLAFVALFFGCVALGFRDRTGN